MKTTIIILVAVVVVVGGYFVFRGGSSDDIQATPSPSSSPATELPSATQSPSSSVRPTTSPTPSAQANVKTFTVSAKNFSFTPTEIKVKLGDRVKITLQSAGGGHDWVVDEFNARTSVVNSGQTATVEFTASKKGIFEYYCSVGTHRQMGMKGNLVVQ